MPFVSRDADGNITAVFEEAREAASEEIRVDDPELVAFLTERARERDVKQDLITSDSEMARVTEDLIATLIEKDAILLTDLPRPAQEKIMRRRRMRERMSSLIGLIDEDDIL